MSANKSQNETRQQVTDNQNRETQSPTKDAKQLELEALYLEQQKRLACPGCGESPFLG
jgi:hypothetical protein